MQALKIVPDRQIQPTDVRTAGYVALAQDLAADHVPRQAGVESAFRHAHASTQHVHKVVDR
ncbi:hypothetical protein OG905_20765 [Streptomyces sp. NBC_00322]|uniref:hypothetical protein n=1 Tax=Streptomyces sp. NBC_00322 TaxID=2975712 RepID=UPI002E29F7C6|nr:hypothetical protein [Streptomyces sp. NBC_00322]